jgi:hypothetical protein
MDRNGGGSPIAVKLIAGGVATGALVWLAARADQASPQATAWTVVMDLAVGVAFVLAGTVAGGSARQRGLVAAVGIAWLVGSLTPLAQPAHQALLILALISFPAGRIRGLPAWLLVAASAVVLLGVVPQLLIVSLFLLAGLLCLRGSHATWYPLVSGYQRVRPARGLLVGAKGAQSARPGHCAARLRARPDPGRGSFPDGCAVCRGVAPSARRRGVVRQRSGGARWPGCCSR